MVAKNEHLIHPVSKRGKEIKNRSLTPSPCIDLRLQKNNNNKSSKDEKPSFSIFEFVILVSRFVSHIYVGRVVKKPKGILNLLCCVHSATKIT